MLTEGSAVQVRPNAVFFVKKCQKRKILKIGDFEGHKWQVVWFLVKSDKIVVNRASRVEGMLLRSGKIC